MFLARSDYDLLRDERTKALAQVTALTQVNAQLVAQVDWMRVRMTELSIERAQMLSKYMGLNVPVPTFEDQTATPGFDPNQTIDFADMGDAAAAKMGIDWNTDGTLKDTTKA